MNPIQAVNTEYKGVIFKSKSEAIIARAMDLLDLCWTYEPEVLRCKDGYVPDFIVKGTMVNAVVEYKPAPVTQTYRDSLFERFERFHEFGLSTILIIGSPFDALRITMETIFPRARYRSDQVLIDSDKVLKECYEEKSWMPFGSMIEFRAAVFEAKKFRFELESGLLGHVAQIRAAGAGSE